MGVKQPFLLVHKGLPYLNVYHAGGILVMSERAADILSRDEFKAVIAHELDHHSKAKNSRRMSEAVSKLEKNRKSPEGSERRFKDFIEFSADKRGADLYSAEVMLQALQKLLAASVKEDSALMYLIFPDIEPNNFNSLSQEQINNRLTDIAEGRVKFPESIGEHSFRAQERFRRLHSSINTKQ